MTKRDIIYLFLILLLGGGLLFVYSGRPKIAYIDLPKVYSGFDMKKELEMKYKNTSDARNMILDSLKMRLQQLSMKANAILDKKSEEFGKVAEQFSLLRQDYQMKESNFSENDRVMMEQYEKDIWNRINKYAKEFSAERKVDVLLGADGGGSVMHVNTNYELTDEFIKYVNENYQGK